MACYVTTPLRYLAVHAGRNGLAKTQSGDSYRNKK